MMNMKYENYKDSGIEWIGEIPCHWEVIPFKYHAELFTGNSIKDDEKALYEDDTDAVPYIATKDINVDYNTIDYKNGMYVKNYDKSFARAPKESTLMCIEGGSAGKKMAFTDQEVAFVNKLCCFTTKNDKKLWNKFLYLFLQSKQFGSEFSSHLSGLIGGVSISELKNLSLILPPLHEQQAIAAYLDAKCGKVDALVAALEQQAADLGDLKKSEISRVVTKGLQPNATLKNSGIEWIGEIPCHWEIVPFKRLHSGTNVGEGIDKQYWTDNVNDMYFYTAGINPIHTCYPNFPSDKLTKTEDLLLARNGTPYVYLPFINAAYTDHVIRVSISPKMDKKFVRHALTLSINNEEVYSVSLATWSASIWNAQKLPIPPLSEQQAIADYLDAYCAKVDAAVAEIKAQIADLKSYKQSLISEAVTGKICVTE